MEIPTWVLDDSGILQINMCICDLERTQMRVGIDYFHGEGDLLMLVLLTTMTRPTPT